MKNFTFKIFWSLLCLLPAASFAQIAKFNSLPTATATIYIDFDGETVTSGYWNNGNTLVCAPADLTAVQIEEIFNRVSEDYRPFNVNITTDLAKYTAAPANRRVRVIVTPTSAWRPGVGGIAYTGSFTYGDNTPAFVFSDRLFNNTKQVAECISHESGHTVGLTHQSRYDTNCGLVETYNIGNGTGETSWAPVMGNSYYRNMTGWNNGPTPQGCTNTQDNLSIITTQNGFTYRTDDHSDALNNTATSVSGSFMKDGIIATTNDKDAFKYVVTATTPFHLEAIPYSVGANNSGANLDVMLQLYNGTTLVRTYNPTNSMSVVLDTTLSAGTYYFVVSGAGNEYISDYGSLGSYKLTGITGALPIRDIRLAGNTDKNEHNLNWTIVADEPIKTQTIEVSVDGSNFRELGTINTGNQSFKYTTYLAGNLYYRLKVVSVVDQTAYSNVVVLRSTGGLVKTFNVSTFVRSEISVAADEQYQYKLSDINGRTIATGNGVKGINKINVERQAPGMYILQIAGTNEKITERIIKQ